MKLQVLDFFHTQVQAKVLNIHSDTHMYKMDIDFFKKSLALLKE